MRELDKALADIGAIRSQIAAGTQFRGLGPAALAASGLLALATAAAQTLWLDDPTAQPVAFFAAWIAAAAASLAVIGVEMRRRSQRHHSGLADAMIQQSVEQFVPAAAAGLILTLVFAHAMPELLWLLPGLWQILAGVGILVSVRSLPRAATLAGGWYLAAGAVTLEMASLDHALSPWAMGLPFAVGQCLMAAIVHFSSGNADAEA